MPPVPAVRSTRSGPITIVSLHRPEVRNAVDRPTADALAEAFRRFDADEESAVAILHGEGGTFCSGADLKGMATERANRIDPEGDGPMGPTRMRLGKPVIAAIEGHAVAGGLELALWCDLRIASEEAVFGVFCRRWGVPLIDGGTVRLSRIVGEGRAMDLTLTGRPVDAAEALRIGLVTEVVAPGTALEHATQLALRLAAFPQTCMRQDRLALLEAHALDDAAALRNEFARGMDTLRSGETLAGAARFAGGAGRHGAPDAT